MMSNNWDIIPTVSIGDLKFGMDRIAVRKSLGKPKKTFSKTDDAVNTTDVYPDYHVYYTKDDKLEAVEFIRRDFSISINSQRICPGTLNEAKRILPDLEESFGSFISKAGSIGICIEDDIIISLLAGSKDYYL